MGNGTGHRTACTCRSIIIRGDVALLSSRLVESNMAVIVLLCVWHQHHNGLVDGDESHVQGYTPSRY